MEEQVLKRFEELRKDGVSDRDAVCQILQEFEAKGFPWLPVINVLLTRINKGAA